MEAIERAIFNAVRAGKLRTSEEGKNSQTLLDVADKHTALATKHLNRMVRERSGLGPAVPSSPR